MNVTLPKSTNLDECYFCPSAWMEDGMTSAGKLLLSRTYFVRSFEWVKKDSSTDNATSFLLETNIFSEPIVLLHRSNESSGCCCCCCVAIIESKHTSYHCSILEIGLSNITNQYSLFQSRFCKTQKYEPHHE
jgi:hypothetical protein